MRQPAGGTPDPNGQGGRTTPKMCTWPDANGPNRTRFGAEMRRAAGDAPSECFTG
jgi:hypothetical protein